MSGVKQLKPHNFIEQFGVYLVLREAGHTAAGVLGDQIRALAEAKTTRASIRE
jgi:hypothetical protein